MGLLWIFLVASAAFCAILYVLWRICLRRTGGHSKYSVRALFWLGCISRCLGMHRIRVESQVLRFPKSKYSGAPLRAVQISDLHYELGNELRSSLAKEAVSVINGLKPDIVFVTGDIVDHYSEEATRRISGILAGIRCQIKYGVLGSHDWHFPSCMPKVVEIFSRVASLKLIDNEIADKPGGIPRLRLVGCGSLLAGDFKPPVPDDDDPAAGADEAEDSVLTIGLSHNPDTAQKLLFPPMSHSLGIDLLLCGHTHGGQVCFPCTRIPVLPLVGRILSWLRFEPHLVAAIRKVVKHWEWAQGLFRVGEDGDKRLLYVNRGLGAHANLRLFNQPEITLFKISGED